MVSIASSFSWRLISPMAPVLAEKTKQFWLKPIMIQQSFHELKLVAIDKKNF
jgi:hypothetical protein